MIRDFMGMLLKRCAVEAVTWLLGVSLQCLLIADAQVRGSVAVDREALEALYHAIGVAVDREALEELYHATGGPDWRNRAYWLSEAPLGEWFGVVTDSNGRVTSLTLTGNGLSGAIPPELGDLTNLQVLWLGHNELIGAPSGTGVNELSGGIPPELADLTNLQWLISGAQRVERGDPAGTGRPDQPPRAGSREQRVERGIPPELAGLTNLQG